MLVTGESLIVIDANGNGIYNEPGVDGMTWDGATFLFPLPAPAESFCTLNNVYTGLTFGPWGEQATVRSTPFTCAVPETRVILQGVNTKRVNIGLTPRPEDPALSADLQKHCQYMQANSTLRHDEDKNAPGFTAEGNKAGLRSILSQGTPPPDIAYNMVQTYLHRLDVLRPDTTAFGAGFAGGFGGIDGRTTLILKPPAAYWPVLCPAPEQTGCGLNFQNEMPDPCPGDKSAGLPITVYFNTDKLDLKSWKLTAIGSADAANARPTAPGTRQPAAAPETVPCYEHWPGHGPAADLTKFEKVVCLIPMDPLKPNTRYRVTMTVMVDTTPWERTWEFATGAGGGK
ncbi:MAG: hypothetical protein ABIF71_15770 [Planctomycetota bacterium]